MTEGEVCKQIYKYIYGNNFFIQPLCLLRKLFFIAKGMALNPLNTTYHVDNEFFVIFT